MNCLIMVKSLVYYVSLGIQNITKKVFLEFIVMDDRFWITMVKIDTKMMDVNLRDYFHNLLKNYMTNAYAGVWL